jgi:hypothetical protein
MPSVPSFIRAEMLPSGYLIRPCDGGGCIIHIVDHLDLEVWQSSKYFMIVFLIELNKARFFGVNTQKRNLLII